MTAQVAEKTEKLSVIIPVFNEERTLAKLLTLADEAPLSIAREIIAVDDGSTDRSPEILAEWQARHPGGDCKLLRRGNGGKGAAVRDGIAASTGSIVIIQDADLEYDPADWEKCAAPILAGEADVVYGSRERARGNRRSYWRFYLGGLAVTWWMNLLFGGGLTDEPTCYKTFRGDLIRGLKFENDDFGWEPEVTAKLLRLGRKIVEVPISYRPRHLEEGKKIRCRDGLKAFWIALEWRFRPLRELRELRRGKTKA